MIRYFECQHRLPLHCVKGQIDLTNPYKFHGRDMSGNVLSIFRSFKRPANSPHIVHKTQARNQVLFAAKAEGKFNYFDICLIQNNPT